MAGIPLSALRRALAEISETSSRRPLRELVPEALGSATKASIGGGAYGAGAGALVSMPEEGEDLYGYGDRLMGNIGRGAAIGAGLGLGAAGVAGARGLRWGLREALAEQAASRGIGRRAVREAADAGDAAAFEAASAPRQIMRGDRNVAAVYQMIAMREAELAEARRLGYTGDVERLEQEIAELTQRLGG